MSKKKIQWKKSGLDYSKLDQLNNHKLGAIQGGYTQGAINRDEKKGFCSLSPEERVKNAKLGASSYWENATEEEIKTKYEKSSNSMKKHIEENGYWRPVDYITPEKRDSMMKNTQKTRKKNHVKRIEEFYNMLPNDWFTLEEAHEVLLTIRNCSKSTTRRMIFGFKESKDFFKRKNIDKTWYYRKIT